VDRGLDPYSQALAKLERGHAQDLADVGEMLARGLVEEARLRFCFAEIEPELYRFPAVDPADFRRSLEELLGPQYFAAADLATASPPSMKVADS